uniref:Major facilitator superfamily MFS_1 n=1 Tax=Cyanothece sp. (strain PCC 7425 / ATCC 29141) TaxID=395961 RepID=B8HQA8_CYAP4
MKKLNLIWTALPAFRSPNFRLWFMGQSLSLLGTWMTNLAVVWLVYHLTGSAFWLGIVSFCTQAPIFVLSLLGGAVVDRYPRRQILLITQTLSMLVSFTLAGLTLTGTISVTAILVLSLFQGIISGFDTPARLSFAPDLLEEPDSLANGIAMFASLFSTTRFLGPAIAGMLIATSGAGVCFLLDSFSYVAALTALIWIRPPQKSVLPPSTTPPWQQVTEGLVYAYQTPTVRSLLLLASFVNGLIATSVLLPVVAQEILQGGAQTLGWLTGCSSLGAVLGSFYLGKQRGKPGLTRAIGVALGVMAISLLLFGLSHNLVLSLVTIAGVGFGGLLSNASSNTLLQMISAEDKRGRVVSLFSMAALGMMALASLVFGLLAHPMGVLTVYLLCGGVCLLGWLYFPRQLQGLAHD